MEDNRPRILGVPVDALSMPEAINRINEAILNKEKLHIVTINAEMVMMTQTDKEFNEILQRSKMLIPDGSGIVIALKKYGQNISRLPGVELARECVKSIKGNIFLFGANETVISTAYESLKKLSGSSNLVGYRNGYFTEQDEESIIKQINESQADIVMIGLGAPKQEKWISKNMDKLNASVFIGVGGSFDIFSGTKKRAPVIMQKMHLEWLYRLYQEPWRWKRMIVLPQFLLAVYSEKK